MSQTCTCDATSSSGAHAVHCQLTARPIISVLACDHAGMIVRCNWCFAVLEEPGALVFTPPDRLGQCTKIHVCVECFKRVILSATPKRSDDGAPKSLLEDLKRCAAEARRQADLLTEERARELKAQWLERWPTPPVEPCARIGCGHAKQAHEGHCHRVGTEVPTHCSQHCGCRAYLPRIG